MISQSKLLEIIYNTSTVFVNTDELDYEQLDRFDGITYYQCDCERCKRAFTSSEEQAVGHANKFRYSIGISRTALKNSLALSDKRVGMRSIGFLDIMKATLHEFIHILYPDFVEMEVEEKAIEWLSSYDWSDLKCSPADWGKNYSHPVTRAKSRF